MKECFALIVVTLFISSLSSQNINWGVSSDHPGNEAINGVAQTFSGDRFVVSMQNISNSFSSPIGEGMISKYNENGEVMWNNSINGQIYASGIVASEEVVWVCGHIDSTLTYNGVETEGNGMFVMQCDMDGNMDWIYVNDSLIGHHSVLGITPEGRPVVSGLEGWGGKSELIELDDAGGVERTRVLPASMISDFDIRENGDLIVGGNGFDMPNFDGVTVDGFIPYVNYLAFFNEEWVAQWIYVSEYITFDHHHRVETLNDQVYFYALEGNNVPLESDVLIFSDTGELQDSIEINSESVFMQMTELAVHANQLEILHVVSNSGSFDFPDTLQLTTYFPSSNFSLNFNIIGEFPAAREGRGLWKIDAKGCNSSFAGLTETNAIQLGTDDEFTMEGNNGHFALFNADLNCSVTAVNENHRYLRVYPNPVSQLLTIQSMNQPFEQLDLVDIHGRVINSFPASTQNIDFSSITPGVYVIRAHFNGAFVQRRIVVQ